MPAFFVHCRTGCTCCSDENHTRGPYVSREDAERRIQFFLDPTAVNNPVASQFAPKGRYEVWEKEVEYLPDGRAIIDNRVYTVLDYVEVAADGRASYDDLFYMED